MIIITSILAASKLANSPPPTQKTINYLNYMYITFILMSLCEDLVQCNLLRIFCTFVRPRVFSLKLCIIDRIQLCHFMHWKFNRPPNMESKTHADLVPCSKPYTDINTSLTYVMETVSSTHLQSKSVQHTFEPNINNQFDTSSRWFS